MRGTNLRLEELQYMDFYSCRSFMDGINSILPIATDETTNWDPILLRENLYNYITEVNCFWDRGEPRPFELLKLPHALFYEGRLATQKGGLLFPDMILCGPYATDEFCPRGKYLETTELNAIEDISTRQGVEIFSFFHKNSDKEIFECKPESFFPRIDNDPFLYILLSAVDYPGGDNRSFVCDNTFEGFIDIDAPPYYDPFRQKIISI